MSYIPSLDDESPFVTAWSAVDSSIPSKTSGGVDSSPNYTFNLDTIGIGPRVDLSSDVITPPDSNNAFWMGDIRSETDNVSSELNYFSIAFENTESTLAAAVQEQRRSLNDDLVYSTYPSAKLTMYQNYRSGGDSLALYVRVLGMLLR